MTHFDTTTPQLKAVDRLLEAYRSCDTENLAPSLSKNFTYRAFPKSTDVPDQTKEEHIQLFRPVFARLAKIDVRIRHKGTFFEILGYTLPPLAQVPRSDRGTGKSSCPGSSPI